MAKKDFSKYFKKPNMKESKKRSYLEVEKVDGTIDNKFLNLGKFKTYYLRTYGCQMNEHDTEIIAGILEQMKFKRTDKPEEADILLFNTCAIRANSENKVIGEIGRLSYLKKFNPDIIFGLCGCMSQESEIVDKILKTYTFIDLIFGTHNIHRLPILLSEAMFNKVRVIEVWSQEGEIVENLPKSRSSQKSAWVNIIYGCDKFCTYCIVPYTRGKERSRSKDDILFEIKKLKEDGFMEVTLLGQNVNAYGKDLNNNYTMANLLEDAAKIGIDRVRFTTSHPWDFDDEMVEIIGKYDNIMPHIHLPVQSGNNEILKIMGRSYTREMYIELFKKLKKAKPNINITTDIIVGYPNETTKQFLDTISLYEECKFDGAFSFIYSPREGTPAAKMNDNIPLEVKKERLYELHEVINKYSKASYEKEKDKIVDVLVIGPSNKNKNILAGYTGKNQLVLLPGSYDLIDNIVQVKIDKPRNTALLGIYIENKIEE